MQCLVLSILALGATWPRAQEDAEAKKARQEKMAEFRKGLGVTNENAKLQAILGLGEITDDDAISLLAGKLSTDTDAIRIAAAHSIAHHRKPASVKALANAIGANAARPEVLKAFIGALQNLDMCSCILVLMALVEINKFALADEALKAIGKIECNESVTSLVPLLQRAEIEEKKPDIFEGTDDAPESENKQKNKPLAALSPKVRDLLASVTGKSFANAREWGAALGGGKVPLKRTSVYLCTMKETTFEVPSGQSKKCPYADGKTLHEDVFLKHLRE
jgi:hypothetical protein